MEKIDVRDAYKMCLDFASGSFDENVNVIALQDDTASTNETLKRLFKDETPGIEMVIELGRCEPEKFSGRTVYHPAYGDEIKYAIEFAKANNARVIYLGNPGKESFPTVKIFECYNSEVQDLGWLKHELRNIKNDNAILAIVPGDLASGIRFVNDSINGVQKEDERISYLQFFTDIESPITVKHFLDYIEDLPDDARFDFLEDHCEFPIAIEVTEHDGVALIECLSVTDVVESIKKECM